MENVNSANTNGGNRIDKSDLAVERKPFSNMQKMFAIVATAIVLVLVVVGLLSRRSASAELTENTNRAAVPLVNVTSIASAKGATELVLPGTTQSFIEAAIYARTSGYLKKWYFDIGAHVHKGQLLAEIETPEIDQQLQSAQGALKTAQANLNLANTPSVRYQNLLKTNSVSQQETDVQVSTAEARKATVDASMANVR